MTTPEESLAVAEKLMTAIENCDESAVRHIYSEDIRVWHNFDQRAETVDENIRAMKWMHSVLRDLNYDVQRREATSDGFFQQHTLRGTLASGEPFALPACAICKVQNNRITAIDEYLDIATTKALRSGD